MARVKIGLQNYQEQPKTDSRPPPIFPRLRSRGHIEAREAGQLLCDDGVLSAAPKGNDLLDAPLWPNFF